MDYAISPDDPGVHFEYQSALYDQQMTTHEYGQPIIIHIRYEGDVTRDAYSSIKSRPTDSHTLSWRASTIDYQPTERRMEKAGLRERADAIIYTAMQDWIDAGIAFDDIEIKRMYIEIAAIPGEVNGTTYEVKEKARAVPFGNGYLCISFGLSKR